MGRISKMDRRTSALERIAAVFAQISIHELHRPHPSIGFRLSVNETLGMSLPGNEGSC
jgi:hypothetical protein